MVCGRGMVCACMWLGHFVMHVFVSSPWHQLVRLVVVVVVVVYRRVQGESGVVYAQGSSGHSSGK